MESVTSSAVLTASTTTVTKAGTVEFTLTASDGVRFAGVELMRDDATLARKANAASYKWTETFGYRDNGAHTFSVVGVDQDGNPCATNPITIEVNISSYDEFSELASGQVFDGTSWDTGDRVWLTKTYMSGDGSGAAKIDSPPYNVFGNYLSNDGEVGQAVLFSTTGERSSSGNLLSIAIDCLGTTPSTTNVNGVEALLNGANNFYLKDVGALVGKNYDIDPNKKYWLDVCQAGEKTYNARLSEDVDGARGTVICSGQIVIATAHTAADRLVQLRTSAANKGILRIHRVEALTEVFEVTGATTTTGTTTTAPAPKVAPVYLFPESLPAIAGPDGFEFWFGPVGESVKLDMVEKLYTDMPVGFDSEKESRWLSEPVTVNGIQFVLMPGLDSTGRASCWNYATFGTAVTQTAINREFADVEFRVKKNGAFIDLFNQGTTYVYPHQRATIMPWETAPVPWETSYEFLKGLTDAGTFGRHDARMSIGAVESSLASAVNTSPDWKPNISFSSTMINGKPQYDQTVRSGERLRATSTGGEQAAVGPTHEWWGRFLTELVAKKNAAWLTPNILKSMQNLAASQAIYSHSGGLIFPEDCRLIDPAQVPLSTHRNFAAWGPCVGIPQPGALYGSGDDPHRNYMYDLAHVPNKVSFKAWHVSKDPFHLLQVQAQAVCAIAYTTGAHRGSDGKTSRIGIEEERGFWWGLQTIIHAWHATPSGILQKPFRQKAEFAKMIDNTLQFVRDNFMQSSAKYSGITYDAARYWRVLSPFPISQFPGEIFCSTFMVDYGNLVLGEMLLLGYSAGRDVAEWHMENIRMRAQAGGNWYLPDRVVGEIGGIAQSIGRTADTELPYSTLEEYKAWYPRQAYKEGTLSFGEWTWSTAGRNTNLFLAVLIQLEELVKRGKITPTFDVSAEVDAFISRHPGPYIDPKTGLKSSNESFAKQAFGRYPG